MITPHRATSTVHEDGGHPWQQATVLAPLLNQHACVVPLTPSCALMLKSEWPSLHPDSADVDQLSKKTVDLSEYLLHIARMKTDWPAVIPDNVAVHMACHVRAQNKGNPAHVLLGLFAKGPIHLIERCSGHGGMWGVLHTGTGRSRAHGVGRR